MSAIIQDEHKSKSLLQKIYFPVLFAIFIFSVIWVDSIALFELILSTCMLVYLALEYHFKFKNIPDDYFPLTIFHRKGLIYALVLSALTFIASILLFTLNNIGNLDNLLLTTRVMNLLLMSFFGYCSNKL